MCSAILCSVILCSLQYGCAVCYSLGTPSVLSYRYKSLCCWLERRDPLKQLCKASGSVAKVSVEVFLYCCMGSKGKGEEYGYNTFKKTDLSFRGNLLFTCLIS